MAFGLASLVKVTALRRFIAVACAFAFLAVSFVHLTHNLDLAKTGISVEMSVLPDGSDDSDASKQTASFDHCDGCMLIATPVANLIAFEHNKPELPGLRLLPMQAILHTAESPPPRA